MRKMVACWPVACQVSVMLSPGLICWGAMLNEMMPTAWAVACGGRLAVGGTIAAVALGAAAGWVSEGMTVELGSAGGWVALDSGALEAVMVTIAIVVAEGAAVGAGPV